MLVMRKKLKHKTKVYFGLKENLALCIQYVYYASDEIYITRTVWIQVKTEVNFGLQQQFLSFPFSCDQE